MTKGRLVRVLAAAVLVGAATLVVASPAEAIQTTGVCVRPSIDWRVPYTNGTCPSGSQLVQVVSSPAGPGEAACIKTQLDVRAPYNQGPQAGSCPSGSAKVFFDYGSDIAVCVKASEDFRAPYNQGPQSGNCASGWAKVWLDTDSAAALPTLGIDNASGDRYNGLGSVDAAFTVTLSAPSASTVTVDYTTVPVTAIEGSDYVDATGTLTFLPGDVSEPIVVNVQDTGFDCAPTATFVVNLTNASNATILDGQGDGTIFDTYDCN